MIKTQGNGLRLHRCRNTCGLFLISVAVFSFPGCAPQRHLQQAEIRPLNYITGLNRVDGLRQALARSPNTPVRVLVVHGMITKKAGYSQNLQQRVAGKLGLVSGISSTSSDIYRGYDFVPFFGPQPFDGGIHLKPSEIRKTSWVDPDNPNVTRLVFYEMLWAPLRDELKNWFLACFESRSVDPQIDCSPRIAAQRNSDPRAIINGALKDNILVDGFADPIIVLGPVGDVLRDDVALAMCMIASDVLAAEGFDIKQVPNHRCNLARVAHSLTSSQSAGLALENTTFFVMTQSLGSVLFMDTQQQFAQTRAKAEKAEQNAKQPSEEEIQESLLFFLTDDATVFMSANQIGLLQLGRISAEGCKPHGSKSECPNRLLRERKDVMVMDMPTNTKTTYVAFNDVNDLLGFELPPYLADTSLFGALVNVSVRNPGFTIPFLFKSPAAAHTGHEDNPAVIEAMVDGIVLSGENSLKAARQ